MNPDIEHYWNMRLERCAEALAANNFAVYRAETPLAAKAIILGEIMPQIRVASASWGDSLTMRATGIIEAIRENPAIELIETFIPGQPREAVMENRRRADKNGAYAEDRGALYNDNLLDLTRRVTRFKQPSAWAEDPPTRHAHVISGIEVYQGEKEGELIVHSTFVNYRSRVEKDNDLLIGRREDVLRVDGASFKIARRKIIITQSVLMAKNLNSFL